MGIGETGAPHVQPGCHGTAPATGRLLHAGYPLGAGAGAVTSAGGAPLPACCGGWSCCCKAASDLERADAERLLRARVEALQGATTPVVTTQVDSYHHKVVYSCITLPQNALKNNPRGHASSADAGGGCTESHLEDEARLSFDSLLGAAAAAGVLPWEQPSEVDALPPEDSAQASADRRTRRHLVFCKGHRRTRTSLE